MNSYVKINGRLIYVCACVCKRYPVLICKSRVSSEKKQSDNHIGLAADLKRLLESECPYGIVWGK